MGVTCSPTVTAAANTVPSAMAKSAVLAMTKSLAVEWGPRGVRFVAIAPGHFPTPGSSAQLGRGTSAAPSTGNPLGRSGDHRELADLAAFLVSDRGGYINGEMVTIDGGYHLRTSGAEDLLGWSQDQWDALKAKR